MDFLKKDIFYPSDGKYDSALIKNARSEYSAYLDEIKSKLPNNLYKLYISNDNFHDYVIRRIEILGNVQCYGAKSDKILIELHYEEIEIILEFDKVSFLKILVGGNDSCWVYAMQDASSEEALCGLEEVVLCELGVVNDKVFKFELLTSSGSIFDIHFSKVKIVKRIKKF